ncbi:MAG TPA: OmpA family protein [Nannocystaceae bacterium]|nr:OmpA family protein [Nannocystaceae bacterium]
MGHRLRSWTAITSRDLIEVELLAGAVSNADARRSAQLLDELVFAAYGDGDDRTRDVVERIFRAVERRDPPEPDASAAGREIQEALADEIARGHLRLTATPRVNVVPFRAGDELMDPTDLESVEPLPPETTWFSIRVVDEVGDPIDGVDLEFDVLGETTSIATDGAGRARLDGQEGGSALVSVRSTSRLSTALKPRWSTPRTPSVPESTAEAPVVIEVLDEHFDPVRLTREIETTLVVMPRFACREIAATTFDFGRSFFRREGIAPLAAIAEELHQDDGQLAWIFGHTDMSGSDKLNKRLSERRAEVIFAVLTHDFARWDALWNGEPKGSPWSERWGTREVQHMLNTLSCGDDAGKGLDEDGDNGTKTKQAIRRFKRRDYPAVPAEQAELDDKDAKLDPAFREQLFLAYAKLVGREKVDVARIAQIGSAPFMGCGEYNPLSLAAKDRESRRGVVFVFDPAAQPAAPPCMLGSIAACAPTLDPVPEDDAAAPYYRCSFYRTVASCCVSAGGADLAHDVIVRFFMDLAGANALSHRFVLEAEDMPGDDDTTPPFTQTQSLADDAREVVPESAPPEGDGPGPAAAPPASTTARMVELHFTHVPDAAKYRLRVEGVAEPHSIFDRTPFHMISELSRGQDVLRMPRVWAILNPPPAPPPPAAPAPNEPPPYTRD